MNKAHIIGCPVLRNTGNPCDGNCDPIDEKSVEIVNTYEMVYIDPQDDENPEKTVYVEAVDILAAIGKLGDSLYDENDPDAANDLELIGVNKAADRGVIR